MQIVPISPSHRRWARLLGSVNLFRTIRRLKPDVLQCTCVEQLPLGILVKCLTRTKVVFDCREDHGSSMREHHIHWSKWFSALVAAVVSIFEGVADRLFDGLVASDPVDIRSAQGRCPKDRKTIFFNTLLLSMFPKDYLPLADRPYDVCMMDRSRFEGVLTPLLWRSGNSRPEARCFDSASG